MPHFLRFNRFRMAVAAYLVNRSSSNFTECLEVVDRHWLDIRTAWELGDRFQDSGNLLIATARSLFRPACAAAAPCQLALPFGPLQQRLPLSRPVAVTPYTLAHS